MRPGTITSTLIVTVITLQLVSLIAVKESTQASLHEQTKRTALHELDTQAKGLIIQAQQFLTPVTTQLSISKQLVADGLLDARDDRTLEMYFLSQLRSNRDINAMYLGRFDGSFVAVARFASSLTAGYDEPVLRSKRVSGSEAQRKITWREFTLPGQLLNEWVESTDSFDPRLRAWYQNARRHDKPVWTNAFSGTPAQHRSIAASVNLVDNMNKDAGVLGLSVDLRQLNAIVSMMPLSELGSAFILDNDMNEIASNLLYSEQLQAGPDKSRLPWREGTSRHSLNRLTPPIDVTGNRLSAVDKHWFSDNDRQVNVQRQLQLFDGALQWRVLVQAPVGNLQRQHRALMLQGMYRLMAIIIVPGVIAIFIILGLSERWQRLYHRATVDFLTRALNREEFLTRLEQRLELARTAASGKRQWVAVVLDLDGFKQINDQFGHDAGDSILKTVVCRLQHEVGSAGFVGRLGGDEFAVALSLPADVDVKCAVERIRQLIVRDPVQSRQASHRIGMTAGVCVSRSDHTAATLLEKADTALIAGKALAKNATYLASETISKAAIDMVPTGTTEQWLMQRVKGASA